jgi:hypothetical protein
MNSSSTANGACDVFVCHVGDQTYTFIDCLRRCVGGNNAGKRRNNDAVKVFWDPHSLEAGETNTPWQVAEHQARDCRIGGHCFLPTIMNHLLPMLSTAAERQHSTHCTCASKQCHASVPTLPLSYSIHHASCSLFQQPMLAFPSHFLGSTYGLMLSLGPTHAAVVVLSPELVHRQHPMRELQIFLERKDSDPSSIIIIPVFLGLTMEQCDDVEGLYHSQPWPQGVPSPSEQERAVSVKEWAAVVRQLRLQPTVARSEEVGAACVPRCDAKGDATSVGLAWWVASWMDRVVQLRTIPSTPQRMTAAEEDYAIGMDPTSGLTSANAAIHGGPSIWFNVIATMQRVVAPAAVGQSHNSIVECINGPDRHYRRRQAKAIRFDKRKGGSKPARSHGTANRFLHN